MFLSLKCWASNPPTTPCDFEWTVDPVSIVAASGALAVAALGFFALIYLLNRKGSA